jgi:hypothetical protein
MQMWIYFTPMLATGLLTTVATIVLRLKNAELTETQLFLRFRKTWTALIVLNLSALAGTLYWLSNCIP